MTRTIAFYLPQYHPTPENDEWWGKGFTEWRNVAKARPLFPDHYQPHLPADLGFYDLRLPEVREAQAALAQQYGIHGFCYYHYWFGGRRILDRPLREVLESKKPDFPFCICWANENWTRAWDGGEREVLLAQNYSEEDDKAHIRSLIPLFSDPRYIRINGKPLFLVYRTELLPDPKKTATLWRDEAIKAGIGEIYLARVESFSAATDPQDIGFDAAVEFAPDWRTVENVMYRSTAFQTAIKTGLLPHTYLKQSYARYDELVGKMLGKAATAYTRFRCVTPGFDNTARRQSHGAAVFIGNSPEKYGAWLEKTIRRTMSDRSGDERIVFINAWNEWAEGNHLEPDSKYGHAFLDATKQALINTERTSSDSPPPSVGNTMMPVKKNQTPAWKKKYWLLQSIVSEYLEVIKHIRFWRCRSKWIK